MRRHDLVYLHPDAAFATPCAEAHGPFGLAARQWIAQGRPLVAARQPADSAQVLLGLSLPLRQQRKRLALHVDHSAIAAIQAPTSIERCLHRLPSVLADALCRLDARAADCSARIGVFGSLAWEVLSGESYRHAGSDIDLICDVDTAAQFDEILLALQQAADALPCRLDGEVRFPDGNAVAWREITENLKHPSASVLVKGPHQVGLLPLQVLTATLIPACCHA